MSGLKKWFTLSMVVGLGVINGLLNTAPPDIPTRLLTPSAGIYAFSPSLQEYNAEKKAREQG